MLIARLITLGSKAGELIFIHFTAQSFMEEGFDIFKCYQINKDQQVKQVYNVI